MELISVDKNEVLKYADKIGDECICLFGYVASCTAFSAYSNKTREGVLLVFDDGEVFLHGQSIDFIDSCLKLLADENYTFCNVEKKIAEYIFTIKKPKWQTLCHIMIYKNNYPPTISICDNVKMDRISLKWAKKIDDNYNLKNECSYERIVEEITNRPSSAVYIDGCPVAWTLLHRDYSMGAMYVMPEYRNCGYAFMASADLMDKVLREGHTPYVQILYDNKASVTLAKKLGFEKVFEAYWFEL